MKKQQLSLSSEFETIVADVNDLMTQAHSTFSRLLFAVCVDYDQCFDA